MVRVSRARTPGQAGGARTPGEGCLPALKCHLPLSVGGASRMGLRVDAGRIRAPQTPALGTRGGNLRSSFPRGRRGQYIGQLLVSVKSAKSGETEVRKLRGLLVSRISPSSFAVIDFLPGRSVRPRRLLPSLSPRCPLPSPSPAPLHTLTQGHTLLQRRRQGVVPVKGERREPPSCPSLGARSPAAQLSLRTPAAERTHGVCARGSSEDL